MALGGFKVVRCLDVLGHWCTYDSLDRHNALDVFQDHKVLSGVVLLDELRILDGPNVLDNGNILGSLDVLT